jgi:hypothetical protein
MSSDIATIGLAVDTTGLKDGQQELDKLAQGAQKAEQTAGGLRSAFAGIGDAFKEGVQSGMDAAMREMQSAALFVESARKELGIRGNQEITDAIERTRQAYETLKASGLATTSELNRAHEAMVSKIKELREEMEGASKETKGLGATTLDLASSIRLAAAAFGLYKLGSLISEAAQMNARFETMGIVMRVAGYNAGYSADEMLQYEMALRKTGISMIEARETITRMAQAQLDLSHSAELARVAQDAAVIAGINSSQAFESLVHGIQSGNVEILRTIGINVNFEESYKRLAHQLGVNKDQLTEAQKAQARMDEVLEYSTRIAGIYGEAMLTAGKQITSMKRYVDDLKVKFGETFNETLTDVVFALVHGFKEADQSLDKLSANDSLREWGKSIREILVGVAEMLNSLNTGATKFVIDMRHIATLNSIDRDFNIKKMELDKNAGPDYGLRLKQLMAESDAMRDKENQVYKEIVDTNNKGYGAVLDAAAKAEAARDKIRQGSLERERKYLESLSEIRKQYADQDIKTQQAAIKKLTEYYYPESVPGPKPKSQEITSDKAEKEYEKRVKAAKEFADKLHDETEEIGLNNVQVKMMAAARAAAKAPTDDLAKSIMKNAQAYNVASLAQEEADEQMKKEDEQLKRAQQDRKKYIEELNHHAKSIEEEVEKTQMEVEATELAEKTHTSLAVALNEVNIKRLEEMVIIKQRYGDDEAVRALQREIDARKELTTWLERKDTLDAETKAAKEAEKEWKKTAEEIERSLTDALMRGFEGGKNFAQNFAATLKNMFATLVLRPIIQPIAQNMASFTTGLFGIGASGNAAAGGLSLPSSAGQAIFGMGSLGTMSSYGLAAGTGGLLAGATQGGMLAAQTAEFGLFGASSTASALGGAAAAGAGLLGTVAAALPWVAGIIAIGSMFGLFGGKPSNKAAGGSVDLSTGALDGLWNMTGSKQASQQTMDARTAILQGVGGFGQTLTHLGGTPSVTKVGVDVGERDGIQFDLGQGMKRYGSNSDLALKQLFKDIVAGTSGLEESVKNLLLTFKGTGAEMAQFATALTVLHDYMKANVVADGMKAIADASMTLFQKWQKGEQNVRDLSASFDGSLASAQKLGTAVQQQYQMELQLVQQIQQALANTQAMFGQSIEQVKLSVMDNQHQYEYWSSEADKAKVQLINAVDPAEIERASQRFNQATMAAYNLLSPDQKAAVANDFAAALDEADKAASDRLMAAQDQIIQSHKDIADVIQGALADAASKMQAAAQTQLDAANTPVKVNVIVDMLGGPGDSGLTQSVEVGP